MVLWSESRIIAFWIEWHSLPSNLTLPGEDFYLSVDNMLVHFFFDCVVLYSPENP